jgi:hypothetical protein
MIMIRHDHYWLQIYASNAGNCRSASTTPERQPQPDAAKVEAALMVDKLNAPSTFPPALTLPEKKTDMSRVRFLLNTGKAYLRFYKTGTKQILANRKVANVLKTRFADDERIRSASGPSMLYLGQRSEAAVTGERLSRSQYQLVLRSAKDSKKLPIFGVLFLILGEWLPLFVFFLGPILPRTVLLPSQVAKRRAKQEATAVPGSPSPITGITDRSTLLQTCRRYGLSGLFGIIAPASVLRARLTRHEKYIEEDTKLLMRDLKNIDDLDDLELNQALEDRALWRTDQNRKQKEQAFLEWLDRQ